MSRLTLKRGAPYILAGLCLLLLLGSAIYIALQHGGDTASRQAFAELSAHTRLGKPETEPVGDVPAVKSDASEADSVMSSVSAEEPALHSIDALQLENPDCRGWLTVSGSGIDYPVMQRRTDPEFYLHRSFIAARSAHGVPFLDAVNEIDTDQSLYVYGHDMRDGSMFSPLHALRDSSAAAETVVTLQTVSDIRQYEVIAVATEDGSGGALFGYTRQEDAAFEAFAAALEAQALWQSGPLSPDDRLLTLVTCDDSLREGRLLVICRETERRAS